MRLIERGDCPMRHENGNCTVAGGFCTAVNDPICEALHSAYDCGRRSIDPASLRPKGEWERGAIISGYQGIGKSTLSRNGSGYIDLESGNFFVDGVRADDWYITYCQIAIHLAEQGYRVFVSSHAVVREYLGSLPKTVDLFVCFPSFSLRRAWVKKLEERYQASQLDKDYRAWKNAEDRYNENIKELHETKGFKPIVIHDMNYSLSRLIDSSCGADMRGE